MIWEFSRYLGGFPIGATLYLLMFGICSWWAEARSIRLVTSLQNIVTANIQAIDNAEKASMATAELAVIERVNLEMERQAEFAIMVKRTCLPTKKNVENGVEVIDCEGQVILMRNEHEASILSGMIVTGHIHGGCAPPLEFIIDMKKSIEADHYEDGECRDSH